MLENYTDEQIKIHNNLHRTIKLAKMLQKSIDNIPIHVLSGAGISTLDIFFSDKLRKWTKELEKYINDHNL